ncbi:hypothetical protein FM037_19180 [Shewanella psychropiezotolerans]|uniref:Uncharacterized protein n=1 Tax=Shewanella psychropiezotolerans TaxID=2593655 RepID=A0ABX5X0S1_9GAMM|nr:hypothetical protein [Shewanella psychropiezotolerans]QDO84957.1 hypothetical protein FM037_19180 [Shewanella psychropiezotolerans]
MNITSAEDIVIMITVTGLILLFPLNMFLTIKLRKKKQLIMDNITSGVPDRLKFRVSFGVNANMSWVFAAYSVYIWFSYLLFRYGHHVTQAEFKAWHLAIKRAFGRYFYLGFISAIGGNLAAFGFVLFLPFYIYNK